MHWSETGADQSRGAEVCREQNPAAGRAQRWAAVLGAGELKPGELQKR